MQNQIFTHVPHKAPSKNIFDLTHDRKFSCQLGELIPCFIMDCVPGDQVTVQGNLLARLAPLTAPFMGEVTAYIHYFFVPNRILWDNWEDFITGGEDGADNSVPPTYDVDLGATSAGTPADYLGLPVSSDVLGGGAIEFSAFPHSAYQLIYAEYYRDQNLVTNEWTKLTDGVQVGTWATANTLRRRAWQHDYFTSALVSAQKGPEALLPLIGEAPVFGDDDTLKGEQFLRKVSDGSLHGTNEPLANDATGGSALEGDTTGTDLYLDLAGTNYADLSQATSTSIIELRRAMALQKYLEARARGGGRYIEYLKVEFDVTSSDKRLQRPEYKGGFSVPIKQSEVLQNSFTGGSPATPLGNMAGHGIGVGAGGQISCYAEEHGYLLGIMSIMPKTTYQQGIPRHYLRKDRFDYFTPAFQHIGEQPIWGEEVAVDSLNRGKAWGYTPRYAEYKFINSSVHGDFRFTLDHWHTGRKFATFPGLNQDFIEMDHAELDDRLFAAGGAEDNIWCHFYSKVSARRPMSLFGEPKLW